MLKREVRDDTIGNKEEREESVGSKEEKVYSEEVEIKRKKAKQKIRDSVFAKLFRKRENVLRLYRELHPEDTEVEIDDIENVTLETVLVDGMYNDLGFSVKDKEGRVKKIVLVEAQTKWDKNMPERMSVYAQNTREIFWKKSGQEYHQQRKMNTPYFEHYVIYTGDEKGADYMKLHEFEVPENSMNLGIKVLREVSYMIFGQYIGFCKIYTECVKKNPKDKSKALRETIRRCKEEKFLVELLEDKEGEIEDIMSIFFDQAAAVEYYGDEREEIGREEGEKRGIEKATERAIGVFLAKEKEKMEATAEELGMTISEYMDMCAQSMKIKREDLIGMCAKNMGMTVNNYKVEYGLD